MILKNQVLQRKHKKPIVLDAHFKANGIPKPIVIFCHGYKGFKDWGCWNLVAERFSNDDFFFVKFNFSHNGGTPENPIDFPDLKAFGENNYTKELEDLEDILDVFLSKHSKYQNDISKSDVTVIGHSRGGGISIIKTAEDSRITKLITWASLCDFEKRTATSGELDAWKKNGVKYVLNGRTKQQMPHHYQFYEDFINNKQRLHIESAIKKISSPILIIHAKEDPSVSFNEAETLKSWQPNSELLAIENSNHVFGAAHPWKSEGLPKALEIVVERSICFIRS